VCAAHPSPCPEPAVTYSPMLAPRVCCSPLTLPRTCSDILSHAGSTCATNAPPAKALPTVMDEESEDVRAHTPAATVPQPSRALASRSWQGVRYPLLPFAVEHLYLLGSPAALFLVARRQVARSSATRHPSPSPSHHANHPTLTLTLTPTPLLGRSCVHATRRTPPIRRRPPHAHASPPPRRLPKRACCSVRTCTTSSPRATQSRTMWARC
jgi:hypothetical protein